MIVGGLAADFESGEWAEAEAKEAINLGQDNERVRQPLVAAEGDLLDSLSGRKAGSSTRSKGSFGEKRRSNKWI